MDGPWQYIGMGLILAGALIFLVHHYFRAYRRRNACNDCSLHQAISKARTMRTSPPQRISQ